MVFSLSSDEKQTFRANYEETVNKLTSREGGEEGVSHDQDVLLDTTRSLDAEEKDMIHRHQQDLKDFDVNVVLSLDQKVNARIICDKNNLVIDFVTHFLLQVSDQQQTLEAAGVPGFYVTNNTSDIKLQMHLLDLIHRLEEKEKSEFMDDG